MITAGVGMGPGMPPPGMMPPVNQPPPMGMPFAQQQPGGYGFGQF